MSIHEDVAKLKKKVAAAEKASMQAEAKYDAAVEALKENYGVKTVAEAEKLLRKLESEQEKLEAKTEKKYNEFTKEFGEKLGCN